MNTDTLRKRIGIIAIQHESNTFAPNETKLRHFEERWVLRGEIIRESFTGSFHEIAGFLEGLEAEHIEAVPIFAAKAGPDGPVAEGVVEGLLRTALEELDQAGPLDGLLVAPHGAGVSVSQPDMDGYWLSAVRERVGPDIPMICTLDPHTNLSQAMVDACDATIAYRTNPHIDQKERGLEAASLMARTVRGEISPVQYAVMPPIAINIERQLTQAEPCASLYASAAELMGRPSILSTSIILGFPYADIPEMGSALIVVADKDRDAAREGAQSLARELWERRDEFRGQMISVEEAIKLAATSAKPVCLLDMGDNTGGGAPGDGTFIAHALVKRGDLPALLALRDPECVQAATDAGIGARLKFIAGGKIDTRHGEPLEFEGTVRSLHDGHFHDPRARHGGQVDYFVGATAVVDAPNGLTFLFTTRKPCSVSLNQVCCCDLDPSDFDVIVVKGAHAPVAAYEEACPTIIRVNTPGITCADMERLTYNKRRSPLFPFETDAQP